MDYKQISNSSYIVRIDKQEEIVHSLKHFCKQVKLTSGSFSGIGAVQRAVIGFFDPVTKQFSSKEFVGKYEVIALNGNISTMHDEPYIHGHISLGGEDYTVFGGHLNSAVVSTTCELVIVSGKELAGRAFNEEIGLNLLQF